MQSRRQLITGLGGAALGLLAAGSGARPAPQAESAVQYKNGFPNVTLIGHDGKSYKFYDDLIRGKVVSINMMYAVCSGICPVATANLAQTQKLLGKRVGKELFMYSITLLPEHDTRAVLNEYAKAHGVQPGWLFLTGAKGDVELLRRKLGFSFLDPAADADRSQHTGMVRIGNEPLNRWGMAPALGKPATIAQALLSIEGKGIRLPA
jgi:protein SCO1